MAMHNATAMGSSERMSGSGVNLSRRWLSRRNDSRAGGYAVPKVIGDKVQERIRQVNPFMNICRVVQVSTGDYAELVSDGTNASSGWVDETGTRIHATGTPTLIERKPTGGELYAYPQMSEWALQDIQFDAADWLIREVAQGFSINLADAIVRGNGSNKPTGMINSTPTTTADDASPQRGASVYKYVGLVNAGSPATLNYDTLVTTIHDLRAEYLSGDRWAGS
jgi:HK97 family phage major capsid protein